MVKILTANLVKTVTLLDLQPLSGISAKGQLAGSFGRDSSNFYGDGVLILLSVVQQTYAQY